MADNILGINEEIVSAEPVEPEVAEPQKQPMFTFYKAPETVEPEEDKPGFFDVLGRASEQTNLMTRGLIAMYENSLDFPADPSFNYRDVQDELRADVPPEYWHEIAATSSRAEADHVKWRIQDELAGAAEVSKAGYAGVAAQLVTGILSPENIIPMGAAYSWAGKGGRLMSAVKTGTLTAAVSGAAEAAIVSNSYTKDAEDILYASTFGMVLGGAVGAATGKSIIKGVDADTAPIQATAKATPEVPKQPTQETTTGEVGAFLAFGPPTPITKTSFDELPIVRETGPIHLDTEVKAQKLIDRVKGLSDTNRISSRVRAELTAELNAISPRRTVSSETEIGIDALHDILGIPKQTQKVRNTETVAGSMKSMEEDMAYASRELRAEMDIKLTGDFDDAGAMRVRGIQEQLVDTSGREDDILDAANDFVKDQRIKEQLDESGTHKAAVMSKILASDYTRLISHPSNVVKKLAYDLLEGGTGAVKTTTKTAAQYKDVFERRILSKGLVPLNQEFSVWAKENGYHWMKRNFHTEAYNKFYGEVRMLAENRAMGRLDPGTVHPSVVKAADAWDEMMESALDIAQKSGIEAFEGIKKRKGYVPLIWNGAKIQKIGRKPAKQLIVKGYESVGIPTEMAQEIADKVIQRALSKRAGVDADIGNLLQKNQRDQLAAELGRMGFTEARINSFVKQLDAREAKAGPSFVKSRTRIDLTMSENGINMIDLVDNDLNTIASVYARSISGRAGLAKKGITSEGKWNAIKSAALKDPERMAALGKKGDDGLSEHLDDVKSYFSAHPVAGGINANARRIQQTATISSLGLVGAAQLAELGTVVGRMGIKAAWKSMPAVKELFTLASKVRKGSDPIIDELRPLLGDFDYDHLLYRPDIILDDKITDAVDSKNWVQLMDKGLGRMSTGLGYASGMNSVRHFEHQLAAKMIVNKFADLAVNPSKMAKSLARMEDIGVSSTDLKRITKSIERNAEFENGTLKRMNLDKWDDELAETFAFAINKHTAQVVQRQLAGETSNWMHKTIGSLLTQFRHFPIVAYEKQLLRNLKFHDQAFYSTMLYGFGVSFAIQAVKAGLAGEDINSPDTFKRTINYMGMASVAPDVLTIAAQLNLVPEALNFRKIGNTGSRADNFDLIDYIPAAGQVNKFAKLAAMPGKAAQGDLTESDVRGGAMALPFATTIFGKALFKAMLED